MDFWFPTHFDAAWSIVGHRFVFDYRLNLLNLTDMLYRLVQPHPHARSGGYQMAASSSVSSLIAGRLALDFTNNLGPSADFSWDLLLRFLLATKIISSERSIQLLSLPETDPHSASALLVKARRLHSALQTTFAAMLRKESVPRSAVEPINDVLQITEGHDELTSGSGRWRLEFVAREDSLEWLLAAVARSAAEIIVEGTAAPLRVCSNSGCGLLFYDTSRTHRRRWCSMARCGNRHKVATFSRRHSAARREH
jgi:predicted RNA-binding Zn ribbon-like protein